jgi:hypothetical protein
MIWILWLPLGIDWTKKCVEIASILPSNSTKWAHSCAILFASTLSVHALHSTVHQVTNMFHHIIRHRKSHVLLGSWSVLLTMNGCLSDLLNPALKSASFGFWRSKSSDKRNLLPIDTHTRGRFLVFILRVWQKIQLLACHLQWHRSTNATFIMDI